MHPATPKKLVHWDTNSPSFESPLLNATIDSSIDSTSSFEFINSQLVAHGYLASPGLTLAGLSNDESNRLAKCLLSMLSQRADDMSRTEQLTTKLRTLNYDHERLSSMHRAANEKAANAEREMNMHKSKQAAALKKLEAAEASHKQTSLELQRTRNLLQGVRATHATELKKKEKEIERILEKWQKLAEIQTKVASASVGFRCSNATIIDGAVTVGRGQGFLDIALDQAEQARAHLSDESLLLRKLLLRAINELQHIIYQMKSINNEDQVAEPVPMTLSTLFPIAPPDLASDTLRTVLEDLRHSLSLLSNPVTPVMTPSNATNLQISEEEAERLNSIISNLKKELALTQKQSLDHVAEAQAMFDKFAEEHRIATSELVPASLVDEEKENLRKELDAERQRFSDAAIKLAKEKAALEAERIKFLDEKRTWQAEQMLADLPRNPTHTSSMPSSVSVPNLPSHKSPRKSPHKGAYKANHVSPRKSPVKVICVGKAGGSGRKAHRVSRRSLAASPSKPVVSYETEYMPPRIPAPSFTFTAPAASSLVPSSSGSLLPTTFVLPPPSPRASLPTNPALPERLDNPLSPSSSESTEDLSLTHTPDVSPPVPITKNPKTPPAVQRGFPTAKPFAIRMMHAYSPAKPSPLSRILQLNDSPLTPDALSHNTSLSPISAPLAAVAEEDDDALEYITNALNYNSIPPAKDTRMSATELGLDSPPETPLQEMKVVSANIAASPEPLLPIFGGRGKVFFADPEANQKKAADKGKGKARTLEPLRTRTGAGEKENSTKSAADARARLSKMSPAKAAPGSRRATAAAGSTMKPVPRVSMKPAAIVPPVASTTNVTTRARPSSRPVPAPSAGGAGPRRVLVTSADAPPIVKGRRT